LHARGIVLRHLRPFDVRTPNHTSVNTCLPYILAYKSLPRISRPPKNRVKKLSKIIDPYISHGYSKLTTCCIIVRILGGFCDAQRSLNAPSYDDRFLLDAVAISDRCDCNWLGLHRGSGPTRPAVGADITWHTGLLVAAKPETAAAGVLY